MNPQSRLSFVLMSSFPVVERLAGTLDLSSLLEEVRRRYGNYEVLDHWTQGEFHHDVVLRLPDRALEELSGRVLVVATNCNGGVKEVLSFFAVPDRWALWHFRCPAVADFSGELLPILARAVTEHWFDPCELLAVETRSELLPEHRTRQRGGGWKAKANACGRSSKT